MSCEVALKEREDDKFSNKVDWYSFRRPHGIADSRFKKLLIPNNFSSGSVYLDLDGKAVTTNSGGGGGGALQIRPKNDERYLFWLTAYMSTDIFFKYVDILF